MPRKIYLLQEDSTLQSMSEQPYDSEDLLQTLLEEYPDLLAGDQINEREPRRWLLVSREIGVPGEEQGGDRWSLDHLFLDQEAIPTLVEVKRSSDTRIRREVVGQMLDYAANAVVYWPVETIHARFEATCDSRGEDPVQVVAELVDAEPEDDLAYEDFWGQVKTNLQGGRIRLVFVADIIPPELKRIVEFLNTYMDPVEVLAVEIKQYIGRGLRTLVPRVVGQTVAAQRKKAGITRRGSRWDETSIFQELKTRHGAEVADTARRALEWAKRKATRVDWGQGASEGTFTATLSHGGNDHRLFTMWTTGSLGINFSNYRNSLPFTSEERRRELLRRLNSIQSVSLPDKITNWQDISLLSALKAEEELEQLFQVFDWVIQEIQSA